LQIRLYELGPTRSARCLWTLRELELPFETVAGRPLLGTDEYKKIHPLGKLPAIEIDGKVLFESAAISTHLADLVPEKKLIGAPGTWARALHEQWSYFALSEVEAWLWVNAKHTFVYPEEQRIEAILKPNAAEASRALRVLDEALASANYLVGNRFSVTDIIVSYAVNWGRRVGLTGDMPHLGRYLERLFERPHCTLSK
jgi:glutathione S-transferase